MALSLFQKDIIQELESSFFASRVSVGNIEPLNDDTVTFEIRKPKDTIIHVIEGEIRQNRRAKINLRLDVNFWYQGDIKFDVTDERMITNILKAAVYTSGDAEIVEIDYTDGDVDFVVSYSYQMGSKSMLDQIEDYINLAIAASRSINRTLHEIDDNDEEPPYNVNVGAPYSEDYTGYR